MSPVTRFHVRDVLAHDIAAAARLALWLGEWGAVGWLLSVLFNAFVASPATEPTWSVLVVALAFLGAGSTASALLWRFALRISPWTPPYRHPDTDDADDAEPFDSVAVADVIPLHRAPDTAASP